MKEELKLKVSELKRNNIIDHAEKLFSELGTENTTIDLIAKDTGISKRTVYTYFSSKTELYNAILCRANKSIYEYFFTLTQKEEFILLNPKEKLNAFWDTLINFKKEKNLYFKIITMYENQKEDINTTDEYLKNAYEWGQKIHFILKKIIMELNPDFFKGKNSDEIILILWITSVSILNTIDIKKFYLQDFFGINTKEFGNTFLDYITYPLLNNKNNK